MAGVMYTHITDYPIVHLRDYPKDWNKPASFGKPVGFWFAPDLEWAKLMSAKGTLGIRAPILSDKTPTPGIRAPKYLEMYEWALGYRKEGSPPMVTEETKLSRYDVPYSGNHFVYQFSLDGKLENDMEKPGLDKVFNLTKDTEKAFVEKAMTKMTESEGDRRITASGNRNVILGYYYSRHMSAEWGGINFDKSLFEEAVVKESWKYYLEVPSGCLWRPTLVFGLEALPEIPPKPNGTADWDSVRAANAPPPTAVLAWAWSREGANGKAKLLEKWADKLSIAGFDDQENLVFFRLKGQPPKGGRRGRTFRRKPKRSNKNGSRFTRKSKHDVRRNRHA